MFDPIEFSKMEFRIHGVKDLTTVPRVNKIVGIEVLVGARGDKALRYLIYMYDQGSPFLTIRDVPQRKRAAALEAGFDFTKDESYLRDLFDARNHYAVLIVNILREQNNALYSSIVLHEELYYKYSNRLLKSFDVNVEEKDEMDMLIKQQKLLAAANEMQKSLDRMYKEMAGGDIVLEKVLPTAVQLTKTEVVARQIAYRN